jgi:hypothetical protein
LGSKRVCDPEAVRVFQGVKHQAERVCLQGGMRFLGGFAIPEERAESVATALDHIGEAFAQARATFVAGYGEAIAAWIGQHPAWEAAIRRAVEPASRVEPRLGFGYQLYRVAPVEQSGNLEEEVSGLGDTLFAEIAQMARTLDQSFIGKAALARRALSTFRRIREKLGCLAFVDYRVEPVSASLDDWLARLPATGAVSGGLFTEGFGLMRLVSDPQLMSAHGAGLLALQELVPVPGEGTVDTPETAAQAEDTEDGEDVDEGWSFGGPLGDFGEDDVGPAGPETGPAEEPAHVDFFYF